MADEVIDVSICYLYVIRWVDEPHEYFIVSFIACFGLIGMSLDAHNCRGQCYDGAS